MPLIYIGGPMTGRPNYNRAAFFQVEEDLVRHGFEVISPARFGDARLSWQQNMRRAIQRMMDADAAVFLPGTAGSEGAWTEWTLANQIKMPVLWLPCGRLYEFEAEKLRKVIDSNAGQ